MREDDFRREVRDLSDAIGALDVLEPEKPQPRRPPVWLAIAVGLAVGLAGLLYLFLAPPTGTN